MITYRINGIEPLGYNPVHNLMHDEQKAWIDGIERVAKALGARWNGISEALLLRL